MLNNKDFQKYSRQILLKEISEEGQVKLKNAKVLVVGAGGLGCPVLQYLTAAGVGNIGIVDFDVVEESNLHRQVLYSEEDIGRSKAIMAEDKLRKQNSDVKINSYNEKLTTENAEEIFDPFDIIVDCTDTFSSRYLINDLCVIQKKPMVYGSVHRYQGQVSVFNFTQNYIASPTYRCLFPEPPQSESNIKCDDIGVLGVLPGLIGMIQSVEVIKIITGIGEVLSGKLLCFDILTMESSIIEIERNPFISDIIPFGIKEFKNYKYDSECKSLINVSEITAGELREENLNSEEFQFIDVREDNEQTDINEFMSLKISLSELENQADRIRRDGKVIFFCNSGKRSAAAISLLENKYNYTNLYNLKGGIAEWIKYNK